jgi:dGTPase
VTAHSKIYRRDSHRPLNAVDCTWRQREHLLLAKYAMFSERSEGRRYAEPLHPYRGPFQRDRDRVLHSAAFRRLSGKMQVFTGDMGDYHRTRLTHTHEVATIARTIGRVLRLNEDLIEALALLHDIGHPPFGHSGEDALDACLADHGGFSHNRFALTSAPSSSGLGHRPFTAVTRVRVP